MTPQEEAVASALAALGIDYERHEHPPASTVGEAVDHWRDIDALHCKNLFLRNQKGDRHYLLVVVHTKRVDLRAVAAQIGDGKLSFASPDRLLTHLCTTPGSVSPLALIHDAASDIPVFIDADFRTAERVSCHPNINTVTVVLRRTDFERFLASRPNRVRYLQVAPARAV